MIFKSLLFASVKALLFFLALIKPSLTFSLLFDLLLLRAFIEEIIVLDTSVLSRKLSLLLDLYLDLPLLRVDLPHLDFFQS